MAREVFSISMRAMQMEEVMMKSNLPTVNSVCCAQKSHELHAHRRQEGFASPQDGSIASR